jgi:IS30 family transposase
LRTGRPLRKHRRIAGERCIRFLAPATLIDYRPAVVEERTRLGDWEGDLIVGRLSRSAIGTLVDRKSRVVRLIHLPDGHGAEQLRMQLINAVGRLPDLHRLTLTWDQGSEMAQHDQIAAHFRDGVFFAHPGSPWQRGSNENMNGLLRQYFPKGSDLSVHTQADLHAIEIKLNQRPRKTLQWRTPDEVFAQDAMLST